MAEYLNYSNLQKNKDLNIGTVDKSDLGRIRGLASRWSEIANSDEMQERKKLWKAMRDLKPVRPMVLFETMCVAGFLTEEELKCSNTFLRNVERTMLYSLKQYDQLNDDIVLENYYRVAWIVNKTDYGVKIVEHHAENSMAYLSNFPIQKPEDLEKLVEREFSVDRETTYALKNLLEEVFGDTLPVKIGNYDNFFTDPGFTPFTGLNFIGITMDLFKLIGYDNMLLWVYDRPEVLNKLQRYLCDDRIRFYKWLESEKLIDSNADNQSASGASGYGYISDLPAPGSKETYSLMDVWGWPESQETTPVSPQMFNDMFLPYIAEVANMFGLTYYGCCEPLHDRVEHIMKALPNLRGVSVSGWSDFQKMADLLGKKYVYSRKPTPSFISGKDPNWESAEQDIRDTFKAARDCSLEFIVRDVYDVNGDVARLKKWVDMTKGILGI